MERRRRSVVFLVGGIALFLVASWLPYASTLQNVVLAAGWALVVLAVPWGTLRRLWIRFRRRRNPAGQAYHAYYDGCYPALPKEGPVTIAFTDRGVVFRFERQQVSRRFRHDAFGKLSSSNGEFRVGRRSYSAQIQLWIYDRLTRREYKAQLFFDFPEDASNVFHELLNYQYKVVNAQWAVWRTIHLTCKASPEQLQQGFRRLVPFTRKICCPYCMGKKGRNPSCSTCRGNGLTAERDLVELIVPPSTQPGRSFVFQDAGNEDPNGHRGPVVITIQLEDHTQEPTNLQNERHRQDKHIGT